MSQAVAQQFKNNLAAYRKHQGLTQESQSLKLGISRARLSLWESGRELPSWEMLRILLTQYEASLEDLYPNRSVRDLLCTP
mgnify:CR=1 FL=1